MQAIPILLSIQTSFMRNIITMLIIQFKDTHASALLSEIGPDDAELLIYPPITNYTVDMTKTMDFQKFLDI